MILSARIDALALSLQSTHGMKRNACALLLGMLLTLALPPVYLFFMIVPAFSGLLLLLESSLTGRRAFLDGWWFGVGFFVTGLYWITISLFTDLSQFWWLIPFALFGLPLAFSLYIGIATYLFWRIKRGGIYNVVWLATLWTIAEYARGYCFTGFPWNLVGYVWTVSTPALQSASIVGTYGLGWLTVLLGTSFALLVPAARRSLYLRDVFAVVFCWLLLIGWGAWRVYAHPTEYTDVTARLVQPNIPQDLTRTKQERIDNVKKLITLSRLPKGSPVSMIIWPESGLPFYIDLRDGFPVPLQLGSIIPPGGLLITGADRVDGNEEQWSIWNSVFAINEKNEIVGHVDKSHLVPFGEYVPFRHILPMPKITEGSKDFSTGSDSNILKLGSLSAAIQICYEAIFPELAVTGDSRPNFLLTVTNDAWFGTSSGPYQHFHMARLRAVEQGLPMIRVANTGISGVIDPVGRVISQSKLNADAYLDAKIPAGLKSDSIYSGLGEILTQSLILLLTVLVTIFPKSYNRMY